MDHLPQDHDKSSAPRKDHPLNEKGVVGEVVVLIPPDVDSDEFLQSHKLIGCTNDGGLECLRW
jgi:hypothetical protein